MVVVEVLVFIAGAMLVLLTLLSAVRTVAVPRAEQVVFGRVIFAVMALLFGLIELLLRTEEHKESLWARYAPLSMLLLPFSWATAVIVGFSGMFWALGVRSYQDALVLSGSSFTTLGFRSTDSFVELLLAIVEAMLGLGLIALLISFMPSLYAAFARREALVSRLEVRAGRPPSPEAMILRAHRIGSLGHLGETWVHWEQWFVEIEESHSTYPALNFFRSPVPWRSWVNAAEAVLDSAAFVLSSVQLKPSPEAALCIRSGYLALNHVAGAFGIVVEPDPHQGDPISFPRERYEALCDVLEAEGVPVTADRDQGWLDFAGWRVNYDLALLGLQRIYADPPMVLRWRPLDQHDRLLAVQPPIAD